VLAGMFKRNFEIPEHKRFCLRLFLNLPWESDFKKDKA